MKKVSVMVNDMGYSQLSTSLIRSFNKICESYAGIDTMAFYRDPSMAPITPLFSCMSYAEIWGYDGAVIATDLRMAKSLIEVTGPKKKYFYLWDLEWLRMPSPVYRELSDVYNSDSLELIVRSEHHSEIVSKCWKKPSLVMKDFDPEVLLAICGE